MVGLARYRAGWSDWDPAGVTFHVTDTYFVVAHLHYVLFERSSAGIYFLVPAFCRVLGQDSR
jgi:heme/copper-type cytochrome/quinol oxidase subunit 1